MNKKRCSKCNIIKDIILFFKDKSSKTGYTHWCKKCCVKSVKKYRRTKEGNYKYKILSKKYRQTDKYKNRIKEYKKTDKYKISLEKHNKLESTKKIKREWMKTKKGKISSKKAYTIAKEKGLRNVYNKVRRSGLKKENCIVCKNKKTEAHHFDYNKPLEVVWLCIPHHKKLHRYKQYDKLKNLGYYQTKKWIELWGDKI